MSNRVTSVSNYMLRGVVPVMFAGLITFAVGLVFNMKWATNFGGVAFVSGLLLCGVGNCIQLGWSFVATLKENGVHGILKDVREQPRGWGLVFAFFLLYATLGVGGAVLILAVLGVFK